MNLPNKLTLLRFLLVPVFMFFVERYIALIPNTGVIGYNILIALIIFAVASFTDFLDGSIARKYNLVTDFGKFMDPLADKVLTTAAIVYLVRFGLCSPMVLIIILTREFAVSGIRMIAATSAGGGKVIAASMWGKAKTVMQMISIIVAFLFIALDEMQIAAVVPYTPLMIVVINVLMWIVAITTVVSGLQYIIPNFDLIKNAK